MGEIEDETDIFACCSDDATGECGYGSHRLVMVVLFR